MNDFSEKDKKFYDGIEKIHDQLSLISNQKEIQLKKEFDYYSKTRYLLYSVILIGFLLFFIMLILNVFYLIILLELIITTIYLIFAIIMEIRYRNSSIPLFIILKKLNYEKKSYLFILYSFFILIFLIPLSVTIIFVNPIIFLIIIAIGLIYRLFDDEKK